MCTKVTGIFGFALALVALYAGIVFEFKHFYEFLLVGLLCILNVIYSLSSLTLRQHIKLYVYFLATGLVVDLLLGLYITKLWYYNYNLYYEFILLYTIVYPLGGYVIVWSFLSLKEYIPLVSVEQNIPTKIRLLVMSGSIILTMVSFFSKPLFQEGRWAFMFAGVSTICMILFWYVLKLNNIKNTYLGYLLANPTKIIVMTLLVVYGNMFLHELPNVIAQQWVYTITTNTILDSLALGIPIGLWILWPSLFIGPLVLYNSILRNNE